MKSTQIIWIDDKTSEIQNVVNEMFESLWENNIRSNIYIFAESFGYNDDNEADIKKLNDIIVQVFVNYLISKNWIDDKKGDEAYSLINLNNNLDSKGFIPKSDVANNKSHIFNELNELISKNNAPDLSSVLTKENGFAEDRVIMIDMCLSEEDFFSLVKDKNKIILSMYLYDFFINQGYSTYMYTTFTNPKDLINKWRGIYEKNFKKDEIKFFNRSGEDADDMINGKKLLEYILEQVRENYDSKSTGNTNN